MTQRPCFHERTPGACRNGAECRFSHIMPILNQGGSAGGSASGGPALAGSEVSARVPEDPKANDEENSSSQGGSAGGVKLKCRDVLCIKCDHTYPHPDCRFKHTPESLCRGCAHETKNECKGNHLVPHWALENFVQKMSGRLNSPALSQELYRALKTDYRTWVGVFKFTSNISPLIDFKSPTDRVIATAFAPTKNG